MENYIVVHFYGKPNGLPDLYWNGRNMVDNETKAKIYKSFHAANKWSIGLKRRCFNTFVFKQDVNREWKNFE